MGLAALASNLIDFCYPRACAACKEPIDESIGPRELFCADCGVQMADLESAAACELCGMPAVEPGSPCPYCHDKGVPHFDRIVRLGVFRDPLKHLIHQMKYHRRWPIAELLARRLLAREPVKTLLSKADLLVPVPLHAYRQISRGYNQAEVIARTLGRICRIPVAQPLLRVRRTPMQTTMTSIADRAANLRGAFVLERHKRVRGKNVVLVDDVMTTGATLQSAAREIEKAQPAGLAALVVAVADPRHRDFQAI